LLHKERLGLRWGGCQLPDEKWRIKDQRPKTEMDDSTHNDNGRRPGRTDDFTRANPDEPCRDLDRGSRPGFGTRPETMSNLSRSNQDRCILSTTLQSYQRTHGTGCSRHTGHCCPTRLEDPKAETRRYDPMSNSTLLLEDDETHLSIDRSKGGTNTATDEAV
jgi:hypothetical protein